jgi:hypothetical protein
MPAQVFTTPIKERQTGEYSFDLVNELGLGIDKAEVNSLTLTYYDKGTEMIINNRMNQNVYDFNNVTILTVTSPTLQTTVTWYLRPEDTIIVDDRHELEPHVGLFQWTWGTNPILHAAHEVEFSIENLTYVP